MDFENTLQFCFAKLEAKVQCMLFIKKITPFKILSTSVPSFALQN